MKITYGEFGQIYKEYKFAYCPHCEQEEGETLFDVYNAGFLPHSADIGKKNYFYMARSYRIPLKNFVLSSENKRVLKKFEGVLSKEKVSASSLLDNEAFFNFCHDYFEQKHGPGIFNKERLRPCHDLFDETAVWVYYDKDRTPVAYIIEPSSEKMRHYWFSFYDLQYATQSLGMWLMVDATLQAQKDGFDFYYLGTVYAGKALYKTNIRPMQYWNGSSWTTDIDTLKEKMRQEALAS